MSLKQLPIRVRSVFQWRPSRVWFDAIKPRTRRVARAIEALESRVVLATNINLPTHGVFELTFSSDGQEAIVTQFANGQASAEVARVSMQPFSDLQIIASGTGQTQLVNRFAGATPSVTFAGNVSTADAAYVDFGSSLFFVVAVVEGRNAGFVNGGGHSFNFTGVTQLVVPGNHASGQLVLRGGDAVVTVQDQSSRISDPTHATGAVTTASWFSLDVESADIAIDFDIASSRQFSITCSGGNDRIDASASRHLFNMQGDVGNDTLISGTQADALFGGAGDDLLIDFGTNADVGDYLAGNNGADTLQSNGAAVTADLTNVRDLTIVGTTLSGVFEDNLTAPLFGLLVYGSNEPDRIDASASSFAVTVSGGDGADTIIGSQYPDLIFGDSGNDSIDGGGSIEIVVGYVLGDAIYGGDGDDRLLGDDGSDFLSGEAGNDYLDNGDTRGRLDGGLGDDTLDGVGSDLLYSIVGSSLTIVGTTITGNGNDIILPRLSASLSSVVVYGNEGDNLLDASASAVPVALNGFGGNDTLLGSPFPDQLLGDNGDDSIRGGDGADFLGGGDGHDRLFGDDGADALASSSGNDLFSGGEGDDYFYVYGGQCTLDGGSGFNSATILVAGDVSIVGNKLISPSSPIEVLGDSLHLAIVGDQEGNRFDGSASTMPVDFNGGEGDDTLIGSAFDDALRGGLGNDVLMGGIGNDYFEGNEGNDVITADEGNDVIFGGSGDDTLIGGDGLDLLYTEGGADAVDGGAGQNFAYLYVDNDLAIVGSNLVVDGKMQPFQNISRIEIFGNDNDNRIDATQSESPIVVSAGGGNDTLLGSRFNDTLNGDAGNDSIIGNNGNDVLSGFEGADQIFGGAGHDNLSGGDGNDLVAGDDDDDTLNGGSGADTIDGGTGANEVTYFVTQDLTIVGSTVTSDEVDLIWGSFPQLRIIGSSQANRIDAALSNYRVVVFAGAGDDTLIGGAFADGLLGEDGNDVIHGNGLSDFLNGGSGNDQLSGGDDDDYLNDSDNDGDDSLSGGNGNDTLQSSGGVDSLDGGSGSNSVTATITGDATIVGGDLITTGRGPITGFSNFNINGDDGPNRIDATQSTGPVFLSGFGGDDTLLGSSFRDQFNGGPGNDFLKGNDGDDFFTGAEGNDTIIGDAGSDVLNGDAGDDSLSGGDGNDSLQGGDGNDTIDGGTGRNLTSVVAFSDLTIQGMTVRSQDTDIYSGNFDRFFIGGNETANRIDASASDLPVSVLAGAGDDTVLGSRFVDDIYGGAGNDSLDSGSGDYDRLFGEDGNDTLTGGPDGVTTFCQFFGGRGDDVINSRSRQGFVEVFALNSLTVVGSQVIGEGTDQIFGSIFSLNIYATEGAVLVDASQSDYPVNARGRAGHDTLIGSRFRDTLIGGLGNDLLEGREGDDSLDGGIGNDVLRAGSGRDYLSGGDGTDTLDGGAGPSTVEVRFEGQITINGTTIVSPIADVISGGISQYILLGSARSDFVDATAATARIVVFADGGDDTLLGGLGNDALYGQLGDDFIRGGAGNDLINGDDGNDQVLGDDGKDLLFGSNGRDLIRGGAGDDAIDGGSDNDTLYGGTENDTFTGGDGDDQIFGQGGTDWLGGGAGSDTLDGGGGDSVVYEVISDVSPQLTLTNRGLRHGGQDVLIGRYTSALIRGTLGNDLIDTRGFNGPVTVEAGSGNDTVLLGAGDDLIRFPLEDSGRDLIDASSGALVVEGSFLSSLVIEQDRLVIDGVASTLLGYPLQFTFTSRDFNEFKNVVGPAETRFVDASRSPAPAKITTARSRDTILGSPFADTINSGDGDDCVVAGAGRDVITGGNGNDTLKGGDGADSYVSLSTIESDSIQDVAGINIASFVGLIADLVIGTQSMNGVVTAVFGSTQISGNFGAVFIELSGDIGRRVDGTLTPFALNLKGSNGADSLTGGRFADTIVGGNGNDVLSGLDGNDQLDGGEGNDNLLGGSGNDSLCGSGGNDSLKGNSGNDTLEAGDGNNRLIGDAGDDILIAGSGDDSAFGHDGNDYITVGAGNDRVEGGLGNDTILAGDGNDTIFGQDGDDAISGGVGNDLLYGEDGRDTVLGGAGDDTLFGGAIDDILLGEDGDDRIDGQGGLRDTISGGSGTDNILATANEIDEAFVFDFSLLLRALLTH